MGRARRRAWRSSSRQSQCSARTSASTRPPCRIFTIGLPPFRADSRACVRAVWRWRMLTPETMHRELIGAYNRRDFAAMKSLLDEDYVYVSSDGKAARGIEAGLQNAYLYATAFPDAIIEVARVF